MVPADPMGCLLACLPGCWSVGHGVAAGLLAAWPGAWDSEEMGGGEVTVFVCGDVMPGRGVDQILPHPGDPELREAYVRDARAYVDLAEDAHGPIPRPAAFGWPWGGRAAGARGDRARCPGDQPGDEHHRQWRIRAGQGDLLPDEPGQRRLPGGGPAGRVRAGEQPRARLRPPRAGRHLAGAVRRGAAGGGGRVGPRRGPAAGDRPGARRGARRHHLLRCRLQRDPGGLGRCPGPARVNLLPDLSPATADGVIGQVRAARRPGDVAVVSIHWGPNWGYDVDADQVRFARALIDGGADLVHGHSSHHPRPIEVFRGKLILYGCGDCINDYEGITGHRAYRPDLRLLYFASLEAGTGQLTALRMAPMRTRRMRLHQAPAADRQWLRTVLDQISRSFGSRVDLRPDGMLALRLTR